MPASTSRLAFAAAAALYLSLSVATGISWEWEHDEGVSFSQAFGLPKIPGQPEPSRPILETYQRINGQTERRAADVMDALRVGGGMHPPAYYLLLHHWGGWFGTQRLVLRLPIYLAGILSLLAARSMTRRLVNPRAGTWAMFLLASSPWFIGFSNLARPYALAVCAALLSTSALLIALESGRLRWRLAFAGASLLGLYSIYPYVYVLGWQLASWFVVALGRHRSAPSAGGDHASATRWSEMIALAGVTGIIALGFAAWLPSLLHHLEVTGGQRWYFSGTIALADMPDRCWRMLRSFALGEAVRAFGATGLRTACAVLLSATALTAVLAVGSASRVFSRAGRSRGPASLPPTVRAFWLCMPLVPLAMLGADWLRDSHTAFMSRQSFALFPLLLLGTVRVLTRARIQWLGSAGLACWLALLIVASVSNVVTRVRTATALETVAQIVRRSDAPTTRLILSGPVPGYVIPLLLSLRDAGVSELRVQYAQGEHLYQLVEDTIRSEEEAGLLRLVNFGGRYGAEARWSDKLLADIERRATAVGWDVKSTSPGPALGRRGESVPEWMLDSLGTNGPDLLILTPVGTKSFDP